MAVDLGEAARHRARRRHVAAELGVPGRPVAEVEVLPVAAAVLLGHPRLRVVAVVDRRRAAVSHERLVRVVLGDDRRARRAQPLGDAVGRAVDKRARLLGRELRVEGRRHLHRVDPRRPRSQLSRRRRRRRRRHSPELPHRREHHLPVLLVVRCLVDVEVALLDEDLVNLKAEVEVARVRRDQELLAAERRHVAQRAMEPAAVRRHKLVEQLGPRAEEQQVDEELRPHLQRVETLACPRLRVLVHAVRRGDRGGHVAAAALAHLQVVVVRAHRERQLLEAERQHVLEAEHLGRPHYAPARGVTPPPLRPRGRARALNLGDRRRRRAQRAERAGVEEVRVRFLVLRRAATRPAVACIASLELPRHRRATTSAGGRSRHGRRPAARSGRSSRGSGRGWEPGPVAERTRSACAAEVIARVSRGAPHEFAARDRRQLRAARRGKQVQMWARRGGVNAHFLCLPLAGLPS